MVELEKLASAQNSGLRNQLEAKVMDLDDRGRWNHSTEVLTLCLHSIPSLPFVATHQSSQELSRPVCDPETAVEMDRIKHKFGPINNDQYCGWLVKTARLKYV